MHGESYAAWDLAAFAGASNIRDLGSLLLTWVENCARFGTVETNNDGRILHFSEKSGVAEPGWINSGIYLISRALLELIPTETPLSIEREIFPSWLKLGLGSYSVRGPFIDIGTPESLAQAASFFVALGRPPSPKRFVIVDRDGTIIVEKNMTSPRQTRLFCCSTRPPP